MSGRDLFNYQSMQGNILYDYTNLNKKAYNSKDPSILKLSIKRSTKQKDRCYEFTDDNPCLPFAVGDISVLLQKGGYIKFIYYR